MITLEGHISKAFDGALGTLHVRVIEMGGLVLSQAREATLAYTEWNPVAARTVLERESVVNQYNRSIDTEQLTLLARRQPVASDLRAVIAMSKVIAELERAGDEAKKVAKTVLSNAPRPSPATGRDVRHIGLLAVGLLRQALEAFDSFDAERCASVIAHDKELDAEYVAGLRRLLTRAMEDPRSIEVTLESAFVLKSLERIGDHARNIARHVLSVGGTAPTASSVPTPSA